MMGCGSAEVSGPLLISYFIDNMVAKNNLPLKMVAGLAAACGHTVCRRVTRAQSLLFNRAAVGVVQQLRRRDGGCRIAPATFKADTNRRAGDFRVTYHTEVIRDLYVTVCE